MSDFFDFLKILVWVVGGLIALLLILASLPNSNVKYIILYVFHLIAKVITIILAVLAAIYVVSPVDFIPDLIPILGQVDDAGAVLSAITSLLNKTVLGKILDSIPDEYSQPKAMTVGIEASMEDSGNSADQDLINKAQARAQQNKSYVAQAMTKESQK